MSSTQWQDIARKKLLLMKCVIVCCFTFIAGALFVKSLIKWDHKKETFIQRIHQPPLIYDRNGEIIAFNAPTVSVYTFVKKLPGNHEEIAERVSNALLKVPSEELIRRLNSTDGFLWIKRHLTPRELNKVLLLGIPGLYFQEEIKRVYISRNLFAHILGYVDNDNLGIAGFEYYWHTNKKNDSRREIYLSLDAGVQYILHSAMQEAVEQFNAVAASGIVMDANSGEIIAFVSLPDFDPNHVQFSREEERFNRVSLGRYEFGSIMKIFTVACALESGSIREDETYDVLTPLKIAGHTIKDMYKPKKAIYSIGDIVKYSSNVGMVQIAMKMGFEAQYRCFEQLGFFDDVKVELPERSIPNRPKESLVTSATLSYGYGFTPTLLHVVQATAMLVNDSGCLPEVTLLSRSERSTKCVPVIKEEVRRAMARFMRDTVLEGSGRRANAIGYQVGGKTGSAEKSINGVYLKDKNLASFIAIFPTEKPQYVIAISVDEAKSNRAATGGVVSAPIAKKVIMRMAPLMNIKPVEGL